MAEVITHWPEPRETPAATFEYPWDRWARLDENGHGDIWLATRGIDFPATSTVARFRGILVNRAQRVTKMRERDAPLRVMRVKGTNKVRRVPDFSPLRVKTRTVSDEILAFQFYDSPEPPAEPEVVDVAVPDRRRRKPLHRHVTRRVLERV